MSQLNSSEDFAKDVSKILTVAEMPNFWQWAYLKLWIVPSILVFATVNFLLAKAGIRTFPFTLCPVDAVPDVAKGHVITAAAGIVAGFIGLVTFSVTYHQKQYLQAKQTETSVQIAALNLARQNEWENQRLQQQREHFDDQRAQERAQAEYDAIASEYDALSKDFVASAELSRINAAIGLSSIALRPDPRRFDSRSGTLGDLPRTVENFPWFDRVARQLAASLTVYTGHQEREQVRLALAELATFCDEPRAQHFLHLVIKHVAGANRTIYSRFLRRLATVLRTGSTQRISLAASFPLHSDIATNAQIWHEVLRLQELDTIFGPTEVSVPDGTKTNERLATAAAQLRDVTYALEMLLSCRRRDDLEVGEPLKLIGVFLMGVCPFPGSLANVRLEGVLLQCSDLDGCDMSRASLFGVSLDHCSMVDTGCRESLWFEVKADHADLSRADFTDGQLTGCQFRSCDFDGANFEQILLMGSTFERCNEDAAIGEPRELAGTGDGA